MWDKATVFLLKLSWTFCLVSAIARRDLFPYGPHSGDSALPEGDDETSEVLTLKRPLYFYETKFSELYVGTNGIISPQDFPRETQYVDDGFPTDFPVIAPFLADLDTSNGKGAIYYREDDSTEVLIRAAEEVKRGFPESTFSPTAVFIATWDSVGPYEELTRNSVPSNRVNTFQVVLAYDDTDTFALFLYPHKELQFYGTRPKESYNVQLELPARVGFSRGELSFMFLRKEGPFYSVTSSEQTVKNLHQVGNTGVPGLWLYRIGSSFPLDNVVAAEAGGAQPGGDSVVTLDSTLNNPGQPSQPEPDYPEQDYSEEIYEDEDGQEEEEEYPTPSYPEPPESSNNYPASEDPSEQLPGPVPVATQSPSETDTTQLPEHHLKHEPSYPQASYPDPSYPQASYPDPSYPQASYPEPSYPDPSYPDPSYPQASYPEPSYPEPSYPDPSYPQASYPEPSYPEPSYPDPSYPQASYPEPSYPNPSYPQASYPEPSYPDPSYPQASYPEPSYPEPSYPNPSYPQASYPEPSYPEPSYPEPAYPQASYPEPSNPQPREADVQAVYPEGGVIPLPESRPPHTQGRSVVSVDEDVDVDAGVFVYNTESRETCAQFEGQCSRHAYCSDYLSGFCCHCQSGYYGNGRHCLPDGVPHRVNGKVSGRVLVGATPVDLGSVDLHAYVVVSDGRAYTAISHVPEPAGWALMPLSPIGGLFGWLFALELTGHENGFSVTGAEFARYADITFYPGNERLSIIQKAQGLDSQNYLTVSTEIQGQVPFVSPGATVQMEPYKELYQYLPSVVKSSSLREYTVLSVGSGSQTFSYQLSQNVTYQDCRHRHRSLPDTQQLSVERVFMLYNKEEQVLRYALTNQIGPVREDPEPVVVSPCYEGTHECDMTAQCIPGEGTQYQCRCATGYRGDGRNCYDMDECAEGLSSCGSHSLCVNLQGSHRCECQSGYHFTVDGRTCIDIDECASPRCDPHATCFNTPGSFHCRCVPGYKGDGLQCLASPEPTQPPRTACEQHRHSLQGELSPRGPRPAVGAYVPQCDEEGNYQPLQCHGSTGHCWCVDSRGQERPGTRTPPGTPPTRCDLPEPTQPPRTACEQHRHSLQGELSPRGPRPAVGAYVPQCDEEGNYQPLQCHGSTGHCWCVDSRGQERPRTRTPPGTPPTRCDLPEPTQPPRTACEQHRHSLQGELSPRGPRPAVGAYVPQCDEEGNYQPLQCHGSTGHCWCVDSRGQERPGTRTPPGTPPTRCDLPAPTQRPESVCERWRASLLDHYGGRPAPHHFIPQCDDLGLFNPLQCYGDNSYCWCVDQDGRELEGTRSQHGVTPACIPTVAPPTLRPTPRPDVTPPPAGVVLLYAQGQQIGSLPLNGTRLSMDKAAVLLALHGSIVVGIDYDCRERTVYWTDVAARTISRASLEPGAEPESVVNSGLLSPEGLAVDYLRRSMFWVDSGLDKIEAARLDGTERHVLFDTDLVNPRAIAVDPRGGNLYWTDWNREGPKIETSTVDGANRRVLVKDDIGLPNALTFDPLRKQLCWADAGTKRLECAQPDGTGRHVIHSNLNYPFSLVSYSNHFYYTDWRRDGVMALSRDTSQFTDEYLPDQRSHLYGITVAYPRCASGRK
ncbi:nidogen-2-like [Acipenser ruthenus]|uniref:nidogen-2-like n=1 Tax=Acipenser ruthenus TaxID=7906 RepID=UPI0027404914|nr:nidogen-2-like [Acipenser ruthenus]